MESYLEHWYLFYFIRTTTIATSEQQYDSVNDQCQCRFIKNFRRKIFNGFVWSVAGHILAFGGVYISLDSLGESPSLLGVSFSYLTSTCCGVIAFFISEVNYLGCHICFFTGCVHELYNSSSRGWCHCSSDWTDALMLAGAVPLIWLMKQYFEESK